MAGEFRLPDPPKEYNLSYMNSLIRQLELALGRFQGGFLAYQIGAHTETRTIDLTTATQNDINNFLLTLADDLYRGKRIP